MCQPQYHRGSDGESWKYVKPKDASLPTKHIMVSGPRIWITEVYNAIQDMELNYSFLSSPRNSHFFLSFDSVQESSKAKETIEILNETLIVPAFDKKRDEERMNEGKEFESLSEEEILAILRKRNRVPRVVVHYADVDVRVESLERHTSVVYAQEISGESCQIPGLSLVPEFVSEEVEEVLLALIDGTPWDTLARRRVQHYGKKFSYKKRTVDLESNATDIPEVMNHVVQQMGEIDGVGQLDQVTVNEYTPGVGLSPHVDTHSAFGDTICSLSLKGGVAMVFRRDGEQKAVYLPPRSLLIMQGESRWAWEHYIPHRKSDVLENGEVRFRSHRRVSLTCRSIRQGPCTCPFPHYCDSQLASIPPTRMGDTQEEDIEHSSVHTVYNAIAPHFSATRFAVWPRVKEFIESIPYGSIVADVGCGNGKYFGVRRKDVYVSGSDRSEGLARVASKRLFPNKDTGVIECPLSDVAIADGISLPYRPGSFDAAMSIAVIHHMASVERRVSLIDAIGRILRVGGQAIITAWATEQHDMEKIQSWEKIDAPEPNDPQGFSSPNDYLVPWHLPLHRAEAEGVSVGPGCPGEIHHEKKSIMFKRYYHLFEPGELEKLIEKTVTVKLVDSFYDRDNWCIIVEKIS